MFEKIRDQILYIQDHSGLNMFEISEMSKYDLNNLMNGSSCFHDIRYDPGIDIRLSYLGRIFINAKTLAGTLFIFMRA